MRVGGEGRTLGKRADCEPHLEDTMSTGVLINTADFRSEWLIIYHADRVESTGTTHQTEEESGWQTSLSGFLPSGFLPD